MEFAARTKSSKKNASGKPFSFLTKTEKLDFNKYSFTLTAPELEEPLEHQFTLMNFVWATTNYEPFIKRLVDYFQLVPTAPSAIPADFAKKLASADSHVLITESERVGKALTANPLDAGLHEQAALLQATYGLIDFAGGFGDTRLPLHRISAHLSIAKVLSNDELSMTGQVAEIALECLACRDGVAKDRATALLQTETDPTIRSWLRAITIRATGDYRMFDKANHTELEALEYGLRAGVLPAVYNLRFIQQNYPTYPVRWLRIISLGPLTADTEKQILDKFTKAEIADFLSDYNFSNHRNLTDISTIKGELDKFATRCLVKVDGKEQLMPISWEDVAAYHCRQIIWATLTEINTFDHIVPRNYFAYKAIYESYNEFSNLTLWHFVLRNTRLGNIPHKNFFARTQDAMINHPELVSQSSWLMTNYRADEELHRGNIIPAEKFFNPSMPFGTAYWYDSRKRLSNCAPTLDGLEEMRLWAPCDSTVCADFGFKKYGLHPTAAQWTEAYGPQAEFNPKAMITIASANVGTPEKCISDLKKLAAIDPTTFFSLAQYCRIIGRTKEAVAFAEEGVGKSPDERITINCTVWLMNYYLDHGMMDKADKLMKHLGAHVIRNFLVQKSAIAEKRGDLLKAEELLDGIHSRFKINEDLCAFLIRNKDKNVKFNNDLKKTLARFYPNGMPVMRVSDFKGNPQRGVIVHNADWMEPNSPITNESVIVAVNGIPVEDVDQMHLVTRLTDKDSASVIFWDGTTFREAEKKFGFTKDFHLDYSNYLGSRSRSIRKMAGVAPYVGDRSLAAITPDCFGANRCGILGFKYDGYRVLTKVFEGFGAHQAGLKVGDRIIAVDKVPVHDLSDREVEYLTKGLIGTLVTMTVSRDGRQFDVIMKRQHSTSDEDLNRDN